MNKYQYTSILALQSALCLFLLIPTLVYGADSTSFRLYDDISDIADQSPMVSTSYSLNEGGETWVAYPLTGSNFQIVTAPPTASSSSSASSAASSVSSEAVVDEPRGSHRGERTNERGPTTTPRPSAPDVIPDEGEPVKDPLPDVDFVPDDPDFIVPTEPVPDERRERRTDKPHFFDYVEDEPLVCPCPEVRPAAPVETVIAGPVTTVFRSPLLSLLLLILAFCMGYLTRLLLNEKEETETSIRPKKKK